MKRKVNGWLWDEISCCWRTRRNGYDITIQLDRNHHPAMHANLFSIEMADEDPSAHIEVTVPDEVTSAYHKVLAERAKGRKS